MSTNNIYTLIKSRQSKGEKLFAALVDPGKQEKKVLCSQLEKFIHNHVDLIFVGGSLVSERLDETLDLIKKESEIPTIIFPGSLFQLSHKADALLLISLISGRNPDLLIGQHVQAAPYIKKNSIETISTGYILVGEHADSAVSYISNTRPIPFGKDDLIVATAIAGELIGHQLIYLEGGSGAKETIPARVIQEVKKNITIPLVIGGGISTREQVRQAYEAGADIVVVGNAFENNTY